MSILVNVHGGTAYVETDFGTSPLGATAHLPLNKLVWGDDSISNRVNESTPLPVQIMAVTGESLVVSGSLGASGFFGIENKVDGSTLHYVAIAGSTDGLTPVGVTGTVSVSDGLTTGTSVNIRALSSATDSVEVTGSINLDLNSGTDSIAVYGWDGGRYVNSILYGGDGTTIGNSGDAINVNLVNTGTTFTFTAAAVVGVTNQNGGASPEDALMIQGISGATPIAVKGRNGEAVEVVNTPGSAVAVTGDFFVDGTQIAKISEITRPSSIISGYTLAAVSSTVLPSNALKTGITIKASKANTDFIYVGNSGLTGGVTSNGYPLSSGESIFIECNNSNLVYVIGTTGDTRGVYYIGS